MDDQSVPAPSLIWQITLTSKEVLDDGTVVEVYNVTFPASRDVDDNAISHRGLSIDNAIFDFLLMPKRYMDLVLPNCYHNNDDSDGGRGYYFYHWFHQLWFGEKLMRFCM